MREKYENLLKFLLIVILLALIVSFLAETNWKINHKEFQIKEVGNFLFENYGITFLIVGILLTASMLAGVYLAKEEKEGKR